MHRRALFLLSSMVLAVGLVAGPAAHAAGGPNGVTNPRGFFVVGDLSAVPGAHVQFWGAQWSKHNSLSGGSAPAAFKGFADIVNDPACPTLWSTDPGNSAPPPDAVANIITVIVATHIDKSGSVISGDGVRLATVLVDPGYDDNPGHAGTGTVLTVFDCGIVT